jgi:hypothetical protein
LVGTDTELQKKKTPEKSHGYGLRTSTSILSQGVKCVIAVVTKIFLHLSQKILNEIQLTVKLWQKNAKVAC